MNYISVLTHPDGLYGLSRANGTFEYRYWFLGFKSGIGKYALVLITFSSMYCYLTQKKSAVIVLFISIVTSILTSIGIKSSSGLATTVMLALLLLVIHFTRNREIPWFRMRNLGMVVVVLFATMVLSQVLLSNKLVVYIINELLGETLTLSSRTPIWERVLEIIWENPITGVGYLGSAGNVELIGISLDAVDAHNLYLEYVLEGGMIAGVFLICMFTQIICVLDKNHCSINIRILSAGLFCILIMFLFENTSINMLWIYFAICRCAGDYTDKAMLKHKLKVRFS